MQGQFGPPPAAGYSIGTPLATSIPVTRLEAYPPGVTDWRVRAINVATGQLGNFSAITSGTGPVSVTALASATQYRLAVAYYLSGVQVGEWGDIGLATTA